MNEQERKDFDKKAAEAMYIIRLAYDKLMSRQFFYYNIASQFALKAVDPKLCPTMGVAHKDGVMWLVYNPEFIKYYNYNEISVILEHEICHFTYDHVKHFESNRTARRVFKPGEEEEAKDEVRDQERQKFIAKMKNIATDRSINVFLFGLPNIRESVADCKMQFTDKEGNFNEEEYKNKMKELMDKGKTWFKDPNLTLDTASDDDILESNCITESSFKSILEEAEYPGDINAVKKYGTWKYYYDLLMSCPKTEKALEDIKEMDVHFGDEEGDGEGGRDAQEGRDRVIMEAARNSNKHDIPGDLRDKIKELFDKYSKEKALPWNVILRRMVNASMKSIKKNDINSRNKYAPGRQILPGYRLDPIKDVCVIWDTSGSCMDEETQTRFIAEANRMISAGTNLRIYYTDADVEHVQDCKEKMMKPKDYQVTGGGGTALCVGVRRAIADGYKIIIQLTDCYYDFDMTKKDLKGRKIITVSTTDSKAPSHYGPTIHVNNS